MKHPHLNLVNCKNSTSQERTDVGPRTIELIIQHLPHLTHLDLQSCVNITDTAITALIGDENDDLKYPYPALPNLRGLDLSNCSITEQGFIELSKLQLLDQLEYLRLYGQEDMDSNTGNEAILQTPLFSNMNSISMSSIDRDIDTEGWAHLDNCKEEWC